MRVGNLCSLTCAEGAKSSRSIFIGLKRKDGLHGPAVAGAVQTAADAEVHRLRVEHEVEHVRLLAARGEMRQASELGVVLCAERVAAARTARDLERRREGQHAFLRPGEIRADDRIERNEPVVVAVADYRPDFCGAARFLEAALDERKLDVHARKIARLAAQRHPFEAKSRSSEIVGSFAAPYKGQVKAPIDVRRKTPRKFRRDAQAVMRRNFPWIARRRAAARRGVDVQLDAALAGRVYVVGVNLDLVGQRAMGVRTAKDCRYNEKSTPGRAQRLCAGRARRARCTSPRSPR